jgi:hypothetical protein
VKSQSARQIARAAELDEANGSLCADLDAARSKLAKVECRERSLSSKNEGLKKDLGSARTARDAIVKDKDLVQQSEQ